jgi:integrase/recombinase XerD
MPHPFYMWALIDVSTGRIPKFFLFYKQVKFNNITRRGAAPKALQEWMQERRRQLQLAPGVRRQLVVKRENQENSKQFVRFVEEVGNDFDVIYVDNLASQGLPWGDNLIETLCGLESATEHQDVLAKMQNLPLTQEDVTMLRRAFAAQAERSRKRIVFALLYYTGARVNELRRVTYSDLMGVVHKDRLKLVLRKQRRKQRDAIVRVVPTSGQEEIGRLAPDIESFFKEHRHEFLGESCRRPGQVMHEKAWISYINREITRAKEALDNGDVLSSHSFRVGFVTRHLKHADSHVVANLIGHRAIASTLRYNRYVVDEEKEREVLDREYQDQQPAAGVVREHAMNL